MVAVKTRVGFAFALCALAVSLCFGLPSAANADEGMDSIAAQRAAAKMLGTSTVQRGDLTVSGLEESGVLAAPVAADGGYAWIDFWNNDGSVDTTVTSADPSMVEVDNVGWSWAQLKVKKYGVTSVTVSNGTDAITVPVAAYPDETIGATAIEKASYKSIRVTWKPIAGVTGYEVKRVDSTLGTTEIGKFSQVGTVRGATASSATVTAPWNTAYDYVVVPFVECNGQRFSPDYCLWDSIKSFILLPADVRITSVTKKPAKSLTVAWTADSGAASYSVYRSTLPGRGYKWVATTKASTWTDTKVKPGVTYYYQVKAAYPGYGTVDSNTYGQFIPKKSSVLKKKVSLGQDYGYGAYGWNWASPDTTYYYSQGSKLYCVSYAKGKLKVSAFNSRLKKVSTKTVKLPKHGVWGGFFHGPDGNNYVAIGWDNLKESKTKTVIKVIKYSSKWKKGKVATIKGSAGNMFEGIYHPFDAGVASFDMMGSTLYLFTCREMFEIDGVHHQSNIAFSINTKTMTAKEDNIAYTSHSFNQRVRFKDGSIYLADHGDAFNRGICLETAGYGQDAASKVDWAVNAFPFKGNMGDNFTGATLGGMEVGATNVLTCGTAQPHDFKVAGVKGFGDYKQNVYVTVTNRATGKSSVKWLTSIKPKKGKQTVSEARMVKLSDDRFAVMYSITNDKTSKSKFYYVVVNGSGKKVLTKSYKNVAFTGEVQPVLHDGCIYWSERTDYDSKKSTLYRIPALA